MDTAVRWAAFTASIGAGAGPAAAAYDDLARRHGGPGRHYHTLVHVADCLDALDASPGLCDRPDAVELALWFHDAVYDPRANDNEARSAALLREAAVRLGIRADLVDRAATLVLATAHLAGPAGGGGAPGAAGRGPSRDAAAIRDIDLAILGSPPARFAAYEAAVRREYAFLAEEDWRAGRSRVLGTFLGLPRIYLTDTFRERLEQAARANLAASIDRLARPS